MNLFAYETTVLQEGWTCTYCGDELPAGLTHYVNPMDTDGAFCRPGCAEHYAERESRRATKNPRQLGLAL